MAVLMKPNRFQRFLPRCAASLAPLLVGADLCAAPLTWFPGMVLNEPRSSAATAVAPGGSILIFGGSPVGSTDVLVYGGKNVQPITSTRIAPGAVALSSGLFVVYGGKQTNAANSVTRSVLSYNPVPPGLDADPNVFSVSPMNSTRYDMAYAPDAAGYAYAIGGLGNSDTVLASVERYDSVADTWTTVANLPSGRYCFGAVFDGTNTIYTFGGRTNVTAGTETATVLSYNVSGNAWSTLAPLPVATAGSTAVMGSDGKIYVIGGTAGGVVTNLVQVYDRGSNAWLLATPLPSAVTAAGGAVDPLGRLVVIGGADGNNMDLTTTWVSQQLNLPDTAPGFTSYPSTAANCLVPYTYTAHADGNPQPTYQLIAAPAGMQIDTYRGVVTWTPQTSQFGSNVVTIQANNYSGSISQTFNINTVGPPLTVPSHVVVSGYTTASITLTWNPTTYVIGPLTYRVYERTFIHNPRGSGGAYRYHLVAGSTTNSATIGGLKGGSGHTYVVQASAAGVASGYSLAVVAVVPIPAVLAVVGTPPASRFEFTMQFGGYETSRIQATTNPADPTSWVTIATNAYISGTLTFTDADASLFPMRFYRVVSP
jgi:hypothetical protein